MVPSTHRCGKHGFTLPYLTLTLPYPYLTGPDSGDSVEVLDCDADSLVEGQLDKRANSIFALARWHPRWFVLKRDAVLYRPAQGRPAAKMLDLSGVTWCKREGQRSIRIKHAFRVLCLRASSSFECEAWLDALDAALGALKSVRQAGAHGGPPRPYSATAWSAPAEAAVRADDVCCRV